MSYRNWLEGYKRMAGTPAARPDAIVIALTATGTLYAGVPVTGGGLRIRRFRPSAPEVERDAMLEGMMAAVEPVRQPTSPQELLMTCQGISFRVVPGSFGLPVIGKRMVAGRTDRDLEVSTPVRMLRLVDPSREALVENFVEAYVAGDPCWMDYLEQATRPVDERKAA